jgi:hypothetical protein
MTDVIFTKQLLINSFISKKIPNELLDIIKTFCFYDINHANLIKKIKNAKKECIYQINISISRNNTYDFFSEYSQYWCFISNNDFSYKNIHLTAINCKKCGNYITNINNLNNIPNNMLCICEDFAMDINEIYDYVNYDNYEYFDIYDYQYFELALATYYLENEH